MLWAILNCPGSVPELAPGHHELAGGGELVHARIAVAVGDIDLALGRQRRVRAAMERLAAHEGRRLAGHTDGELDLAGGRASAHGVIAVIGAVEIVVRIDVQAVRALEDALAPGAQEVALAVEHHHGVLAAIEHVDLVLAVDGDSADIHELPLVRKLGPVLDYPIAMLATAQHSRHCTLLARRGFNRWGRRSTGASCRRRISTDGPCRWCPRPGPPRRRR